MSEKHVWGWPIASYLFVGGLAGGMTVVGTSAELFFNQGDVFAFAVLAAMILAAAGSSLLMFDLGRPLQFWRVFSKQRAVLTFGAWSLTVLMLLNIVYFTFYTPWFPWSGSVGGQKFVGAICALVGLGVMLYTGVMLSSLKARPFWNTPALPVLFTISGLSTGAAANSLLAGVWPFAGAEEAVVSAHEALHMLDIGLIVFELIVVLLYVTMMYTSSNPTARLAAGKWLSGDYSKAFWGGLVVVGLIVPLAFYAIGGTVGAVLAPVLAIIGGVILRFLVIYSDDRRMTNGEQRYWERLPRGDEAFLKAWE
ncbi:MAG: NrfD/PsrC family molybdoenzyme membrane anchor subunit [Coriobacteriia bacterium]